jgi:proline dehydrogenase
MFFRRLVLGLSGLGFVRWLVTRTPLFRGLVKRFVAGDSVQEAFPVCEALAGQGFRVALDLLGENVASLAEAAHEREAYRELIQRVAASPHRQRMYISIKLTALGLDQSEEECFRNYAALLEEAAPHGIFIRVDMEGSAYTDATLRLVEKAREERSNTGTVVQAMLRRTESDCLRLAQGRTPVRMVKGAYSEPPAIAFESKAETDAAYLREAKGLLKAGAPTAIATHDEAIIEEMSAWIAEQGIDPELWEWQMLFGIRRDRQESLKEAGQPVRIYVPFGASWYPYFTRRLAERPANLVFMLRNL